MMDSGAPLLGPGVLRRLEGARLRLRRPVAGASAGTRPSPARGSSAEFADFRNYTPGDDLRRVDWNAYARLERLYLRLYRAEEDLVLTLFLDTSASMAWGDPPKERLAREIAAALAYVATANAEPAAAGLLGPDLRYLPAVSSRAGIGRVWSFLGAECRGTADLTRCLAAFGRHRPRPGMAVVISDLLLPGGYRDGLRALLRLRQQPALVQVLAPDELNPQPGGDWRLVDAEDGSAIEVALSPRAVQAYRDRLASYTAEIAAFCAGYGIPFVQLSSAATVEEAVLGELRRAGVVG